MWTVVKYDNKNFTLLIQELKKKVGEDLIIYNPKIRTQKYVNQKLISRSSNLIGNYFFLFS